MGNLFSSFILTFVTMPYYANRLLKRFLWPQADEPGSRTNLRATAIVIASLLFWAVIFYLVTRSFGACHGRHSRQQPRLKLKGKVISMAESNGALPDFMRPVVDDKPTSARVVAEHAVLALNTSMMGLYDTSLETFKQNMRDQVPIIVALFSGQGGQMILYRPGKAPEVAPPVPIVYQLAKSVGHSTMAIYEVVSPYLSDPRANQMWRAPLEMYRTQNQSALDVLDALDIADEDRDIMRSILQRNVAFMEQCLAKGTYTYDDVEDFIRGTTPLSVKTIGIASGAQVGHWMSVVEGWRNELGDDWERLYAVNNSMYVTRQNNILYSVLVQFMGTETMGDRLLLVETAEFETTPEKLLDVLGRIVADRSLGMVFFRDFFAMDVELLGGGGRAAIEREMAKRGKEALLPSLAPFRSNDWPWKTDPTKGTGPAQLEDAIAGCPVR